ncbi:MAG: PAS domain S-box protein [Candidatus Sulfotelmatobacter sp.]
MRLLVVDDHEVLRRGVRSLLQDQPNYEVCGEAVDGQDAVEKARELKPDVIVMDISMPRLSGLEATSLIRSSLPDCEVVLLSQHDAPEMARQALKAGARGYVIKTSMARDLICAVERVSRGEYSYDPSFSGLTTRTANSDVQEIIQRSGALEQALRESEQLYRSTFEVAGVGVSHVAPDGRWLRVNRKLCEIVGYSEEELLKLTFQQMTHPDDLSADLALTQKILNGESDTFSMEKRYIRKDGSPVWINLTVTAVRHADRKLKHFVSVVEDISQRKQFEATLKDSDELAGQATALLAAIVDSSDDAIISKNLNGVITSWNKGAERIFGYTAAEATGQHITLIIPEDRREEEVGILRKLRNGQRIDHFETVRKCKDGTLLDISVTISPVKNESGRIIGASKVARDIGHRKRAEADLRRSEEQLRQLSETLDAEVRARTRELEERNAEISLQAEQLRELNWRVARAQEEERRHVARELHDSAGQTLTVLGINAAQLVDEAEGSAPDLAKRGRELQALIQQLHREVRTASYLLHPPLLDEAGLASALNWYVQGLTERSGLSITLDIPNNFGRLSGDMELVIFRLVQECLTNIHRHSGSKTAAIRVLNDGENVRVQVTDEGIGIPPELLAKVQTGGSGVGIRGMQERLRQFRGAMEIVSNGSGTSVIARIPVEKELDQPSTKSPVIWEFRNSG